MSTPKYIRLRIRGDHFCYGVTLSEKDAALILQFIGTLPSTARLNRKPASLSQKVSSDADGEIIP